MLAKVAFLALLSAVLLASAAPAATAEHPCLEDPETGEETCAPGGLEGLCYDPQTAKWLRELCSIG